MLARTQAQRPGLAICQQRNVTSLDRMSVDYSRKSGQG